MNPLSSTLLSEELPRALLLRKAQVKLSQRVVEEVNRLLKHEDKQTRNRAKQASELMSKYMEAGLIQVLGSDDDPTIADQTFLYVFQQFYHKHHLALLTQDANLAKDLDHLNRQNAVKGKEILLLRIGDAGQLSKWDFETMTDTPAEPSPLLDWSPKPHFHVVTEQMRPKSQPITIKESMPKGNEQVMLANKEQVTLVKCLGEGADSIVYQGSNQMAVKLFRPAQLTVDKIEKLKVMCASPLSISGLCWPEELVFNAAGMPIGYMMKLAKGRPLSDFLAYKPVLQKHYPKWTRQELAQLGTAVFDLVKQLHEQNVLIGDYDLGNIRVKSPKEIYVIDTDDYQVNEFPCERIGVSFAAFGEQAGRQRLMRTWGQELHSLSSLAFQLLLPGKNPYTFQGGIAGAAHIKPENFPFPYYEPYIPEKPIGAWSTMWSSLPLIIRMRLFDGLRHGRGCSAESWEQLFRMYRYVLYSSLTTSDIYPSVPVIPAANTSEAACASCGTEHRIETSQLRYLEEHVAAILCKGCYSQIIEPVQEEDSTTESIKLDRSSSTFLDAMCEFMSGIGREETGHRP